MKTLILLFVALSGSIGWTQTIRPFYVAKDSTEADVHFSHLVRFASDEAPSSKEARRQIDNQLRYMIGPIRAERELSPRSDYAINVSEIVQDAIPGWWIARYEFNGRFAVHNNATNSIRLYFPTTPSEIFARNQVNGSSACIQDYPEESLFWYSWKPTVSGCPLKEGEDYNAVSAEMVRLPNTTLTYPEYEKLFSEDGTLRIDAFFGKINTSDSDDPTSSGTGTLDFQQRLVSDGFELRGWTEPEIRSIVPGELAQLPYVQELRKQTARGTIVVRLFYGDTGIYDASKAFHYFYKDALENASVVLYNGHAGLGSNIDVRKIESREGISISPRKDRYQILQVNACFPHFYYVANYFRWKSSATDPAGTKMLDVLADGVEGSFWDMAESSYRVVQALQLWADDKAKTSYQELVQHASSSALFGVNGDEDN